MNPHLAKLLAGFPRFPKTVSYLKTVCSCVIHWFAVMEIVTNCLLCFTIAEAKYAIVRPENRTLCEDNTFHSETADVVKNPSQHIRKTPGLFFRRGHLNLF